MRKLERQRRKVIKRELRYPTDYSGEDPTSITSAMELYNLGKELYTDQCRYKGRLPLLTEFGRIAVQQYFRGKPGRKIP